MVDGPFLRLVYVAEAKTGLVAPASCRQACREAAGQVSENGNERLRTDIEFAESLADSAAGRPILRQGKQDAGATRR